MNRSERLAIFHAYCNEVEEYIGNEYSCFDCGQNEHQYAKDSYEELLRQLGLGYAVGMVEKRFLKERTEPHALEVCEQGRRIRRMAEELADMEDTNCPNGWKKSFHG